MPLKQAKFLIHQINNKLTGALGYIELAGDDANQKKNYLIKANRELMSAVSLLNNLMSLINAVALDALKAATEAAEDAQRSAQLVLQAAAQTKAAADEVAAKSESVRRTLGNIMMPIIRPTLVMPPPKKKK